MASKLNPQHPIHRRQQLPLNDERRMMHRHDEQGEDEQQLRQRRRARIRDILVRLLVVVTATIAIALSCAASFSCELLSIHDDHPDATNKDLPDYLATTDASDTVMFSTWGYASKEDPYCEVYHTYFKPTSWKMFRSSEDDYSDSNSIGDDHIMYSSTNMDAPPIGKQGWDLIFVIGQFCSFGCILMAMIGLTTVMYSLCSSCFRGCFPYTGLLTNMDENDNDDDDVSVYSQRQHYNVDNFSLTTKSNHHHSTSSCYYMIVYRIVTPLRCIFNCYHNMDNFLTMSCFFMVTACMQLGIFMITFQTNLCHNDEGRHCQLEYFGRMAWIAFALYMICAFALLLPTCIVCFDIIEAATYERRGYERPVSPRGARQPKFSYEMGNANNQDDDTNIYDRSGYDDEEQDPDSKFGYEQQSTAKPKRKSFMQTFLSGGHQDEDEYRSQHAKHGNDDFLFYVSDAASVAPTLEDDDNTVGSGLTSSTSNTRAARKLRKPGRQNRQKRPSLRQASSHRRRESSSSIASGVYQSDNESIHA